MRKYFFLLQSGVPRTGYLGVVQCRYGQLRIYITPSQQQQQQPPNVNVVKQKSK